MYFISVTTKWTRMKFCVGVGSALKVYWKIYIKLFIQHLLQKPAYSILHIPCFGEVWRSLEHSKIPEMDLI